MRSPHARNVVLAQLASKPVLQVQMQLLPSRTLADDQCNTFRTALLIPTGGAQTTPGPDAKGKVSGQARREGPSDDLTSFTAQDTSLGERHYRALCPSLLCCALPFHTTVEWKMSYYAIPHHADPTSRATVLHQPLLCCTVPYVLYHGTARYTVPHSTPPHAAAFNPPVRIYCVTLDHIALHRATCTILHYAMS